MIALCFIDTPSVFQSRHHTEFYLDTKVFANLELCLSNIQFLLLLAHLHFLDNLCHIFRNKFHGFFVCVFLLYCIKHKFYIEKYVSLHSFFF